MRISGTEPSSVILGQTGSLKGWKVMTKKCQKQAEAKRDGVINPQSKIEKVPRGIRGEKSSKDMASSRNLVSTIGALASPKMGDGTRCPEG